MASLVQDYLLSLPTEKQKLLMIPEGRRALCKYNFKLFCFLYFRSVMRSPDTKNEITLSEFHDAFIEDSLKYTVHSTKPAASRTAWVCPRGSGKSTWVMMLIIWLGAYQHQSFVALFSATASQSEDMLSNIRGQFMNNELLRKDFPNLVKPGTKRNAELKLSDNKQLIIQSNGFICTGRGVTTAVLGMRIDNMRPSMIILDDVEAGESQTTQTDINKLLVTIQDDILPLSLNAHVIMVGTTTRPRGLTEGLVHKALNMPHPEWTDTENFKVNYWPALKYSPDGISYSIWEERWSTEYLRSQEGNRSFKKNYQCLPAAEDYAYWTPDTFVYGDAPELDYVMLSVDPAVTTKERSDFTGLSVVGYSTATSKTYVLHCEEVKLSGQELRNRAAKLIEMYPAVSLIYVEVNQGGEIMEDVFNPLPIKVKTVSQSIAKTVRAATVLAEYEKGKVVHTRKLTALEDQMVAFPQKGYHDDMIDSVGSAVLYFSKVDQGRTKRHGISVRNGRYT